MDSCLGIIQNIIKIQSQNFRNHPLHPWPSLRLILVNMLKKKKKAEQLVNFLFRFGHAKGKRQECQVRHHPLLVEEGHFTVTAGKAFVFRRQRVSSTSRGTRGKKKPNLAFLCGGGLLEMDRLLFIGHVLNELLGFGFDLRI